jgi:muconolactone delta-isomerase
MACLQEGLLLSLNRRPGHYASSSLSTARAFQTASEELAALQADRVAAREIAELAEREALEAETAGKEALKVQQKVDRDTRYAARKARQRKGR